MATIFVSFKADHKPGFSSNTDTKVYNVSNEDGKLTIDEMNL